MQIIFLTAYPQPPLSRLFRLPRRPTRMPSSRSYKMATTQVPKSLLQCTWKALPREGRDSPLGWKVRQIVTDMSSWQLGGGVKAATRRGAAPWRPFGASQETVSAAALWQRSECPPPHPDWSSSWCLAVLWRCGTGSLTIFQGSNREKRPEPKQLAVYDPTCRGGQ